MAKSSHPHRDASPSSAFASCGTIRFTCDPQPALVSMDNRYFSLRELIRNGPGGDALDWTFFIWPDDKALFIDAFQRCVSSRQDMDLICRSATEKWCHLHLKPKTAENDLTAYVFDLSSARFPYGNGTFSDWLAINSSNAVQPAVEMQQEQLLRHIRHEMSNQLISMSAVLDQGDIQEAKQLLSDIQQFLRAMTSVINTGNPEIDSLLAKKMKEARLLGISVDPQVALPADLNFDQKTLCGVLEVCLDHAIRACTAAKKAYPEVFLSFSLTQQRTVILFKLKYSMIDAVHSFQETTFASVQRLVEKHHGHMFCHPIEDSVSLDFTLFLY